MAGAIPLIVYGVGTVAAVASKFIEMDAASDAAERQYALDQEQAVELLDRQRINEELLVKKEKEMEAYGSYLSGSSGGQNTGLGAKLKLYENLQQTILNSRREALFKAKMIQAGAEIDQDLSSARELGTALGAVGALGRGAYNIYRGMDRPSDTTKDLAVTKIPGANYILEADYIPEVLEH